MQMILAIAAGGAAGALGRHYLNIWVGYFMASPFPYGIMAVNVLGSFLMGAGIAAFAHWYDPGQAVKAFLTVGFLGAFTTFSTFSLDTVMLLERGAWLSAMVYAAGSVICAVAALMAGMWLVRGGAG